MDRYHQTEPPTELKSSVLGRENSHKNKRQKTLMDLESLKIGACKVVKPAGVGKGKQRMWVIQCHCEKYFLMNQGELGRSRSEKRRKPTYHCGCEREESEI